MSVSRNIIQLIKASTKWSLVEISIKSNIPRSTLSSVLHGKNEELSFHAGLKLLQLLDEYKEPVAKVLIIPEIIPQTSISNLPESPPQT